MQSNFYNGIQSVEKDKNIRHEIRAKFALNQPLSPFQRSYYLLFIATAEQAKEFIKNEKRR